MHEVLRVLAAAHAGRHESNMSRSLYPGGVQVFAIMENAYQGTARGVVRGVGAEAHCHAPKTPISRYRGRNTLRRGTYGPSGLLIKCDPARRVAPSGDE